MSLRVGLGYDVHRVKAGRPLVLGGVKFESDWGLEGHSDADVLLHAVGDALLGAAGLGDLGEHFPAGDPRWKNISSMELLRRIVALLAERGARVENVDVMLVAEAPKLAPHRAEMCGNIAKAIGIAADRVSVKATTNETLGAIGRREGLAAFAVALVERGLVVPVRVRFAPSPTGWLHVGGARTAYFNWLYARKHRGAFVLRIEDTDADRSSDASERGVLDDLRWLGLQWDEGPDTGGPHGPYRQSERLALYREHAGRLLEQVKAYRCFCTDAELEVRRAAALAAGRPPQYDGRCRGIARGESDERAAAGEPSSLRFQVPQRDWTLHDAVRGEVTFPAGMVGDFVLLRSSGLPTYNFACVVDDHLMAISHVLRAEEHLANTPRQLMLYEALGWVPPKFAHVALILNADRTKMSKREGEAAVAVGDWRRFGYVPEALLAYLGLLGFHPGDDREVLTHDEMTEAFVLERLGRSGSVFDPAKLMWMNAHWLHHASGAAIRDWVERSGQPFIPAAAAAWPRETLERVLEALRGNLGTLTDLPGELAPFLDEPPVFEPAAKDALGAPRAAAVCAAAAAALAALADWRAEAVKSAIQSVAPALGVKGRELYQPVRAALTGRTHGPELPLIAELLGRERSLARLARAGAARPGS